MTCGYTGNAPQGGVAWHRRRGEPPCPPCRARATEYARLRRSAKNPKPPPPPAATSPEEVDCGYTGGTLTGGYAAHLRRGEPPCVECSDRIALFYVEAEIAKGIIELATVMIPDDWMADALCNEYPDERLWFPERGDDTTTAKSICARCLVRDDCLTYALAIFDGERTVDGHGGTPHGIWGGLSGVQITRMIRTRRAEPTAA